MIDDLTDTEALAFIALWNMVDDEGRHKYDPRELGMKCPRTAFHGHWPGFLKKFEESRLIIPYEVDGVKYFHVRTWYRHQRINRPTISEIPKPPNGDPIQEAVLRAAKNKSAVPMDEGIPYQDIYDLWNRILGKDIPCVKFDPRDSTLVAVRAAWLAYPERQDLKWWKEYFSGMRKSDLLMGKSRLKFCATLRWVCIPENMNKILSGQYYSGWDKKNAAVERFTRKRGKKND